MANSETGLGASPRGEETGAARSQRPMLSEADGRDQAHVRGTAALETGQLIKGIDRCRGPPLGLVRGRLPISLFSVCLHTCISLHLWMRPVFRFVCTDAARALPTYYPLQTDLRGFQLQSPQLCA